MCSVKITGYKNNKANAALARVTHIIHVTCSQLVTGKFGTFDFPLVIDAYRIEQGK